MSETADREVGSASRSASGAVAVPPSAGAPRGSRAVAAAITPGFPPLATPPAQGVPTHSGPRCVPLLQAVGGEYLRSLRLTPRDAEYPVPLLQAAVRGALGLPVEPWDLAEEIEIYPVGIRYHH